MRMINKNCKYYCKLIEREKLSLHLGRRNLSKSKRKSSAVFEIIKVSSKNTSKMTGCLSVLLGLRSLKILSVQFWSSSVLEYSTPSLKVILKEIDNLMTY